MKLLSYSPPVTRLSTAIMLAVANVLFCALSHAQGTTDATVDEEGNLVFGEVVIAPPAGSIDPDGNLELESGVVPRPNLLVRDNGDLQIGDKVYLAPFMPDASGALAFFGVEDPEGDSWIVAWSTLGWMYAGYYPWLYSIYPGMNWLYNYETASTFDEGGWFWDMQQDNWIYSQSDAFPWIWIHGHGWTQL